jgi:1-deoxy-D-xylulose-5-phosphate reductoisomerase
LNAANEVAVRGFLAGNIGFLDIPRIVETTLERSAVASLATLDDVYAADGEARDVAGSLVAAAGR